MLGMGPGNEDTIFLKLTLPFLMQFSRKTGSAVPTRWSEEEIEIALEGEKLSPGVTLLRCVCVSVSVCVCECMCVSVCE